MTDEQMLQFLSRFFLIVFAEDGGRSTEILEEIGIGDVNEFHAEATARSL